MTISDRLKKKALALASAILLFPPLQARTAAIGAAPSDSLPPSAGSGLSTGDGRIDAIVNKTKFVFETDNHPLTQAKTDSARALVATFYMNQFRNFQDPDAPYFMLMSRSADMALGIGGVLKLRSWYDWDGSIASLDLSPSLIQIPKDPSAKRNLHATPHGTSLFFTLLGRHPLLGHYMGYIQGEFTGYGSTTFSLAKAYLTFRRWTMGYATSTFSDPGAEPPAIGSGVNGKLGRTNFLARYVHTLRGNWTLAGAMEFPSSKIQTDATTAKCNDWVPDFVWMGQYSWGSGKASHVRLGLLMRGLAYRDLLDGRNHLLPGWGLQLTSVWATPSPVTLYGIVSVGQGHQSYNNDMSKGTYDLIPDPRRPGRLYAPMSANFNLGVRYQWLPNLFSVLALSEVTYHPAHAVAGSEYRYGLYGGLNLMWNITPRLLAGAEWSVARRADFNGASASVNRAEAMLQLNF